MDQILQWFEANAGKIIFLLVAIVAALLITKGLARVMRKVLDRTDMPSASIFINIMRVLVWILAASIVLQPVFGISPTTLMTALGVGGIAVSLGLKDTVANVISGFGLMLGKVIQPGDLVSVAGTAGVVKDMAAGAVLIFSIGCAVAGVFLFWNVPVFERILGYFAEHPVLLLLLLATLPVAWRFVFGKKGEK